MHYLLHGLFMRRLKKTQTPKLCVTGLCEENPPVTGGSPHKRPVTRKMFPFDDVIMKCYSSPQMHIVHYHEGVADPVNTEDGLAVLGVLFEVSIRPYTLQWRHNEHNGVLNHRFFDYLLNRLFRHRSKKTSKPASLAFVRGNWPMKSPHKGPVTPKMFSFDDVIMYTRNHSGYGLNQWEDSKPRMVPVQVQWWRHMSLPNSLLRQQLITVLLWKEPYSWPAKGQ